MNNIETAQPFNSSLEERIFFLYPKLASIEKNAWLKLLNQSQVVNAPPQTIMQTTPGPYDGFLLLLEGSTRAYQTDETGREITLFRNTPGDVCSVNLQTLFNSQPSELFIQAESSIHGLKVSARAFQKALQESTLFRQYIFSNLTNSITELTSAFHNIVFNKLDSRLCLLLKKMFMASENHSVKITHQQLANELGTTREVISRSLKLLEKKGCLQITRGQLTMVDPEKLSKQL